MRRAGAGLVIVVVILLATVLGGWSWAGSRQAPTERQAGWFWDGSSGSWEGAYSHLIDGQS